MLSRFEVSYDSDAQAAYVHVSGEKVVRTEEILEDLAWMDLDRDGKIAGIEVIGIEPGDLPDVLKAVESAIESVREHLGEDRRQLLALQ